MNQDLPPFELEQVLLGDASDILIAREKARIMHHGQDVRAAGNEVELAFRKVLRRKLPSSYYIGHGHIVDQHQHSSSQLDVVIANNAGTPILFQAEDGTEYFPYEGIYAIGEVKSSYKKGHIQQFADQLAQIHNQLRRETFKPVGQRNLGPFTPTYGSPLFSFMFFVSANDFRMEQISELYKSRSARELPNIICFLDKGVIVNIDSSAEGNEQPIQLGRIKVIPELSQYYQFDSQWEFISYDKGSKHHLAAHFGILYYMLTSHLQKCQLTEPDLVRYVGQLLGPPASKRLL